LITIHDGDAELLKAYQASGGRKAKVIAVKNGRWFARAYCLSRDEGFLAEVALCRALPAEPGESEECFFDAQGRKLVPPCDVVVLPLSD